MEFIWNVFHFDYTKAFPSHCNLEFGTYRTILFCHLLLVNWFRNPSQNNISNEWKGVIHEWRHDSRGEGAESLVTMCDEGQYGIRIAVRSLKP